MIDLSQVPLPDLFAELTRRETELAAGLAAITEWKNPSGVSTSCSESGHRIVSEVAKGFCISPSAIMGRRRDSKTVKARHVAMVALYNQNGSLTETGRFFERDHGTILNAIKNVKNSPPKPTPDSKP